MPGASALETSSVGGTDWDPRPRLGSSPMVEVPTRGWRLCRWPGPRPELGSPPAVGVHARGRGHCPRLGSGPWPALHPPRWVPSELVWSHPVAQGHPLRATAARGLAIKLCTGFPPSLGLLNSLIVTSAGPSALQSSSAARDPPELPLRVLGSRGPCRSLPLPLEVLEMHLQKVQSFHCTGSARFLQQRCCMGFLFVEHLSASLFLKGHRHQCHVIVVVILSYGSVKC